MTYRFHFQGELRKNVSAAQAQKNLARLFRVTETEIAPLFTQEYEFIRDNIDETTANDYREAFNKAGAVGYVKESTAPL